MRRLSFFVVPGLLLCMCCQASPLMWTGPSIDVRTALTRFEIFAANAAGDGEANDSEPLQAAVDYVARLGGGTVVVPPGTYRVEGIEVKPAVRFVGAGQDKTIFRAAGSGVMFRPTGGYLGNFTAYGTPSQDVSGENWIIGTAGQGRGGTARAVHIISINGGRDVHIDNVRIEEARYDCLYTRGSRGLRVTNSHFDRAGRNIVSMVGNDEDFLFSGCYFGSAWGLYHFDIEPEAGRWVRNGTFLNCVFDGREAGVLGGDTWGAFLILTGHEELLTRNLNVTACKFYDISVRVRGVIPGCSFLYNDPMGGRNVIFVKVRTNPVGELRDTLVRGNRFVINDEPAEQIIYGVSFSGNSVFENNYPDRFNNLEPDEPGQETHWGEEDHPVAVEDQALWPDGPTANPGNDPGATVTVTVPLQGTLFRFADGAVYPHASGEDADIALHIDPIIAVGAARIARLKTSEDRFAAELPIDNVRWYKALMGVSAGELLAVRTVAKRHVLMQVLHIDAAQTTFRYRFFD